MFEQRANKFICRLGKSGAEMVQALQTVYGDNAFKRTAVYDWYIGFRSE
jgi:hypothetical protein